MSQTLRQSIPFSGIDTATPDQTVQDGSCSDIFNMRAQHGALHSVCAPTLLHPINNNNGWQIIHKMECLAANEYVAMLQTSWNSVRISVVAIAGEVVGEVVARHIAVVSGNVSDYSLWSFGTVLYLNKGAGEALEERTFVYKDGAFAEFDLGDVEPPQFELSVDSRQAGLQGLPYVDVLSVTPNSSEGVLRESFYGERYAELNQNGYIVGAFSVMTAYVMHDGTIVKPSAPTYVSSYCSDVSITRSIQGEAPNAVYRYKDSIRGVRVEVKLKRDIPTSNGLIKSVRVFVTRVSPMWNYEELHEKFIADKTTSLFGTEYMHRSRIVNGDALNLNVPFYELMDINAGNTVSEEITSSNLNENIVHGAPFNATFSNHKISSIGKFEYNNRSHIYGVKTEFFYGYALDSKSPVDNSTGEDGRPSGGGGPYAEASLIVVVRLSANNKSITVRNTSKAFVRGSAIIPNLITYPDVRAEQFDIIVVNQSGQQLYRKTVVPKISHANNIAYHFVGQDSLYDEVPIYASVPTSLDPSKVWDITNTTDVVFEPNKLLVSRINNPFAFAPENTYLIGEQGSSITALQTATEQISETRFGAFPLYAFTDRAVYALEVGQGEVLYSAVVGIGNDRKLPNTTTVGAANLVFFVSDQGVMALEGRYAACISRPIATLPPETPFDVPFEQYVAGAQLDYNPTENELRVYNPAHDYAFVYSLNAKMWTRRTWSGRHVSPWELIAGSGIVSASQEDPKSPLQSVQLTTRPMKFGSTEYKRIETIMMRLEAGGATAYKITLEGSNDLRSWNSLITTTNARMLRRSMSSYLYHRVRIEASVGDWLHATHLDAEFYNRFVRRLR